MSVGIRSTHGSDYPCARSGCSGTPEIRRDLWYGVMVCPDCGLIYLPPPQESGHEAVEQLTLSDTEPARSSWTILAPKGTQRTTGAHNRAESHQGEGIGAFRRTHIFC